MSFRSTLFWVHLVSGIISGVIIAIMSVTGVVIAFEEEMLAWKDREVRIISGDPAAARPLALAELRDRIAKDRPGFVVSRFVLHRDPARTYEAYAGAEGPVYVDPYKGVSSDSVAHDLHHLLGHFEEWHRWLGFQGDALPVGKLITGIGNLAFLVLCLTGLYLWFPRRWSARAWRPRLWFTPGARGKARDFQWHHVLGLWSFPALVLLSATAVVISFNWGHRLVFQLAGEEPPVARNFGMMRTPEAVVSAPPAGTHKKPFEEILAVIKDHYPLWKEIGFYFPAETSTAPTTVPQKTYVTLPDYMPSRAYVPIESDPYTGAILQATHFADRSAGLRARVWIRFLHTGAGFGFTGKLIATLATLVSLVLIYTGFALSWRRFFRRRITPSPRLAATS